MWKWLDSKIQNVVDGFQDRFNSTLQFALNHYLKDIFEDVSIFTITSLKNGVNYARLNLDYINSLLGVGYVRVIDSSIGQLFNHMLENIKLDLTINQLFLSGLSLTIQLCRDVSENEYFNYLNSLRKNQNQQVQNEKALEELKKQIGEGQMENPSDRDNLKTIWRLIEGMFTNISMNINGIKLNFVWDDKQSTEKNQENGLVVELQNTKLEFKQVLNNPTEQFFYQTQRLKVLVNAVISQIIVSMHQKARNLFHRILILPQLSAISLIELDEYYEVKSAPKSQSTIQQIQIIIDAQEMIAIKTLLTKFQNLKAKLDAYTTKFWEKKHNIEIQSQQTQQMQRQTFKTPIRKDISFDPLIKMDHYVYQTKTLEYGEMEMSQDLTILVKQQSQKADGLDEETFIDKDSIGTYENLLNQNEVFIFNLSLISVAVLQRPIERGQDIFNDGISKYNDNLYNCDYFLIRLKGVKALKKVRDAIVEFQLLANSFMIYNFAKQVELFLDDEQYIVESQILVPMNDKQYPPSAEEHGQIEEQHQIKPEYEKIEDNFGQDSDIFQSCIGGMLTNGSEEVFQSLIQIQNIHFQNENPLQEISGKPSSEIKAQKHNFVVTPIIMSQELTKPFQRVKQTGNCQFDTLKGTKDNKKQNFLRIFIIDNQIKVSVGKIHLNLYQTFLQSLFDLVDQLNQGQVTQKSEQNIRQQVYTQSKEEISSRSTLLEFNVDQLSSNYQFECDDNLVARISLKDTKIFRLTNCCQNDAESFPQIPQTSKEHSSFDDFTWLTFSSLQVSLKDPKDLDLLYIGQYRGYSPLFTLGNRLIKNKQSQLSYIQNPTTISQLQQQSTIRNSTLKIMQDRDIYTEEVDQVVKQQFNDSDVVIRCSIPLFDLRILLIQVKTLENIKQEVEVITNYLNNQKKTQQTTKINEMTQQAGSNMFIKLLIYEVRVTLQIQNQDVIKIQMQQLDVVNVQSSIYDLSVISLQQIAIIDMFRQYQPLYKLDGSRSKMTYMEHPADQLLLYSQGSHQNNLQQNQGTQSYINPFSLTRLMEYFRRASIRFTFQDVRPSILQSSKIRGKSFIGELKNIALRNSDYSLTTINHIANQIAEYQNELTSSISKSDESSMLTSQSNIDTINYFLTVKQLCVDIHPTYTKKSLDMNSSFQMQDSVLQERVFFGWVRTLIIFEDLRLEYACGTVSMNVETADLYIQKLDENYDQSESPPIIYVDYSNRNHQLFHEYMFFGLGSIMNINSTSIENQHSIDFERIHIHLSFDVLEALMELMQLAQCMIPNNQDDKVLKNDGFKLMNQFQTKNWGALINQGEQIFLESFNDLDLQIKLKVQSLNVNIRKGTVWKQDEVSILYDEGQKLEKSIICTQVKQNQGLQVSLENLQTKISIQGTYKTILLHLKNMYVEDQVEKSKFSQLLGVEVDRLRTDKKDHFLAMAVGIGPQKFDFTVSMATIRICLTGYTLQFLMSLPEYKSQLKCPEFSLPAFIETVEEDCVILESQQIQSNDSHCFDLERFHVEGFKIIFCFDSQGLQKGILGKVSSITNLNIKMEEIRIENQRNMTFEQLFQEIQKTVNKVMRSHITNALISAEALKVFSHLFLGVRSLFIQPYKFGLIGVYYGTKGFMKGLSSSFISFAQIPLQTINYRNNFLSNWTSKINPEEAIPSQFLRSQR